MLRGIEMLLIVFICVLSTIQCDEIPPSPGNIALVHLSDSNGILEGISISNKEDYAKKHGYDLIKSLRNERKQDNKWDLRDLANASISACKAKNEYMRGYDWILATTGTILISNHQARLDELLDTKTIDTNTHVLYTSDWNGIIKNIIATRCSEDGMKILEGVVSGEGGLLNETKGCNRALKESLAIYPEEWQVGDVMLSFEEKQKEIEEEGVIALATQYDILGRIDDIENVHAFFRTQYVLNRFSGVCDRGGDDLEGRDTDCEATDDRRIRLDEPIGWMSKPRYKHLELKGIEWEENDDREEMKDEL